MTSLQEHPRRPTKKFPFLPRRVPPAVPQSSLGKSTGWPRFNLKFSIGKKKTGGNTDSEPQKTPLQALKDDILCHFSGGSTVLLDNSIDTGTLVRSLIVSPYPLPHYPPGHPRN